MEEETSELGKKVIIDDPFERFISKEVERITNEFDKFLEETDTMWKRKRTIADLVNFIVSYNQINDYFKIEIFPAKKDFFINAFDKDFFDSQKYFAYYFEKGFGQFRIGKFAEENNIGIFTY